MWNNHRPSRRRRPPYRPPRRGAVRLTPTALAEIERLVYGDHTGLPFSAGAPTVPKVTSVFGRTGVVVAQTGDYTAAQVTTAANKGSLATQTFLAAVSAVGFISTATRTPINIATAIGAINGWHNTTGVICEVRFTGIGPQAHATLWGCRMMVNTTGTFPTFTTATTTNSFLFPAAITGTNNSMANPLSTLVRPGQYVKVISKNSNSHAAKAVRF